MVRKYLFFSKKKKRVLKLLNNLLKNQILFWYLMFIIFSPIIYYAIFSSLTIPETPRNIQLDLIKFNEPDWVFKQVVSIYVFSLSILATLLFWKFRLTFAMLGFVILLISNLVEIELVVNYMNVPVILFLIGMMVIIHYLEKLGFFDEILNRALKFTKYEPRFMMITIILISSLMAALVDEVTSILFIATLIFSICKKFNLDPVPFLISAIMGTNIGSSATVVGNPVGVYTAIYSGLSFIDFLKWSTPAAIISTLIIALVLMKINKKYLDNARTQIGEQPIILDEKNAKVAAIKEGAIIFTCTFLLLVSHSLIESFLNLSKNTVLIAAPLAITALILLKEKERAREIFVKSVDWWTLVFFMFLFSMAATFESTGITAKLSSFLITLLGIGSEVTIINTIITFVVLTFTIGLMSAAVDNIVAVAALLPIAAEIILYNLPNGHILWWSAIIGGCYFGNLTPIGSTANIVALSLLEKEYGKLITFNSWIKIGILVTLLSTIIAAVYIISLAII
jgi:Na+/H+ antiporter NhaD/arsenite permease-like protein